MLIESNSINMVDIISEILIPLKKLAKDLLCILDKDLIDHITLDATTDHLKVMVFVLVVVHARMI